MNLTHWRILGITLATWIGFCASCQAADGKGAFAIEGGGLVKCRSFLSEKEKRSPKFYQIGGWIEGYLTAHNEFLEETFDITSWENIDTFSEYVANYCRSDLDARVIAAVKRVIEGMMPSRVEMKSELVVLQDSEYRTTLYREALRRLQLELRTSNDYDGELDGSFDDSLADAIREFQVRNGMPATGFPTQELLHKIFRND